MVPPNPEHTAELLVDCLETISTVVTHRNGDKVMVRSSVEKPSGRRVGMKWILKGLWVYFCEEGVKHVLEVEADGSWCEEFLGK